MKPASRRTLELAAARDDGRAMDVENSPKLRNSLLADGYITRGGDARGRHGRALSTYYITPAGRAALVDAPAPDDPQLPNVPASTGDVFAVIGEYGYDSDQLLYACRARGAATEYARTTTEAAQVRMVRMRGSELIEEWHREAEGAELRRIK